MKSELLAANIGLTYRCNFRCRHCYAKDIRSQTELKAEKSTDWWKDVISTLSDAGVMYLVYAFGESLIREDFYEIARFARDKGFYQILMTNGFHVPERLDAIEEAGINTVVLSLDSSDPTLHNLNRGHPRSHQRVIQSLELIQATRPGLNRAIGFSYDGANVESAEAIIQTALKYGCGEVSLMRNRPAKTPLTEAHQLRIIDLYNRYADKIKILTHDPDLLRYSSQLTVQQDHVERFRSQNQCRYGSGKICIDARGHLLGCSFSSVSLGKIDSGSDLRSFLVPLSKIEQESTRCEVTEARYV